MPTAFSPAPRRPPADISRPASPDRRHRRRRAIPVHGSYSVSEVLSTTRPCIKFFIIIIYNFICRDFPWGGDCGSAWRVCAGGWLEYNLITINLHGWKIQQQAPYSNVRQKTARGRPHETRKYIKTDVYKIIYCYIILENIADNHVQVK